MPGYTENTRRPEIHKWIRRIGSPSLALPHELGLAPVALAPQPNMEELGPHSTSLYIQYISVTAGWGPFSPSNLRDVSPRIVCRKCFTRIAGYYVPSSTEGKHDRTDERAPQAG